MKIIIYYMSSIIFLCQNCHYTSAQYQDLQPPMLLMVKLCYETIASFNLIPYFKV